MDTETSAMICLYCNKQCTSEPDGNLKNIAADYLRRNVYCVNPAEWDTLSQPFCICNECISKIVTMEWFVLKKQISLIDEMKQPTTYQLCFEDKLFDIKRLSHAGLMSQEKTIREKMTAIENARIQARKSRQRKKRLRRKAGNIIASSQRRTERKSRGIVEAEQKQKLIDAVIAGDESGLQVRQIEGKGRGVVAKKTFERQEFVVEYVGELMEESRAKQNNLEYDKEPGTGSFMFYFQHNNKKLCIDATAETDRLGRLINHSRKNGNLIPKLIEVEGVPKLIFLANTQIQVGDELCYDYGERNGKALLVHPWLAN